MFEIVFLSSPAVSGVFSSVQEAKKAMNALMIYLQRYLEKENIEKVRTECVVSCTSSHTGQEVSPHLHILIMAVNHVSKIANAVIDVLCIFVLMISAAIGKKTVRSTLAAMLKLDDDFGAGKEDVLERSITTLDDVVRASSDVAAFCREKKYPPRTAYYVALSIEEIASNILKYGFQNTEGTSRNGRAAYYADVRVVSGKDALTVRFRDNCREFDPRERIKMYVPETKESHIGIRMVATIAKQIDYYNNAGINTTIATF